MFFFQDAVYSYITALLDEAVEYLVKLWGTEKFPIPRDMEAPYLRLVRLPPIPRFPIPEPNREVGAWRVTGDWSRFHGLLISASGPVPIRSEVATRPC